MGPYEANGELGRAWRKAKHHQANVLTHMGNSWERNNGKLDLLCA